LEKKQINIVWIKRDIRSQDHLPFHIAEQSCHPYIIIFVFESLLMDYPDTSLRHLQFQYHSLIQLNKKLKPNNKEVIIFYTDIINALTSIKKQYEIVNLYSYQESGIQLTFNRDKLVQKYCQKIWRNSSC
jgi:deoxyribodipyrimidine photo-lyase